MAIAMDLKVGVVEKVENGQISANQAARLHGVSSTAIRRWVKNMVT